MRQKKKILKNKKIHCFKCHKSITGRGASSFCKSCVLIGNSRVKGLHWKVKDTSKMKEAQNRPEVKAANRLRNTGSGNGMYNRKQTDETKLKIGKGVEAAYKRPDVKEKHRAKMKEIRTGWIHSEITKQKIGRSNTGKTRSKSTCSKIAKKAKIRFQSLEERLRARDIAIAHPSKKFSNTKIEQKIAKELENRGLIRGEDFHQNFGIKGIKNVDFFLPKLNIVIECDGCYYHACLQHNPNWIEGDKRRERDKIKTELLKEANYRVYRFWEHEINASPEKCVDSIYEDTN